MAGRVLTPAEVLDLIPQRRPFRFVDTLDEISEAGARGRYRFREDELFYAGHFPGNPVTPGVILVEAMAQIGVVAHGIWLYALEHGVDDLQRTFTAFTEGEFELLAMVRPGDEVTIRSQKLFFRRKKLRARVELALADGRIAATGTLAGIGVAHGS